MAQFDSRALRNVFGQFATGVCVVTMMDKDNNLHGLTISSFNTVSLEPPLVLWSLRKQSWYAQHFLKTEAFAINVCRAISIRLAIFLPAQAAINFIV